MTALSPATSNAQVPRGIVGGRILTATITLPPGKNRQHEIASGRPIYRLVNGRATLVTSPPRLYNGQRHCAWSQEAMLALRSQDWRILPPGDYAAELEVTTYGQRDVDNPLEAVLDLIQSALELDDRRIERLHARRLDAAADEARIELRLLIWEQ